MVTLFQEMEEDDISAWDCIIDAVAYVSKSRIRKRSQNIYLSPLKLSMIIFFTHMVQSLILCDSMECEYIEVYKNVWEKLK